jgi:Vacuolar sorting protein 9 (VPS9) domain
MVELRRLDEVTSPREKLEIVSGVHKVLVDGLTSDGITHSQSSSADLLLPVLIYRFPSSVTQLTQYHPSEYRDINLQCPIHTPFPRRHAPPRRILVLSN